MRIEKRKTIPLLKQSKKWELTGCFLTTEDQTSVNFIIQFLILLIEYHTIYDYQSNIAAFDWKKI